MLSGHCLPKVPGTKSSDDVGRELDPMVRLTIVGASQDAHEVETTVVESNGFNPCWNERFSFALTNPSVAVLAVEVFHCPGAAASKSSICGSAFPIAGLREGIRWAPLRDPRHLAVEKCG